MGRWSVIAFIVWLTVPSFAEVAEKNFSSQLRETETRQIQSVIRRFQEVSSWIESRHSERVAWYQAESSHLGSIKESAPFPIDVLTEYLNREYYARQSFELIIGKKASLAFNEAVDSIFVDRFNRLYRANRDLQARGEEPRISDYDSNLAQSAWDNFEWRYKSLWEDEQSRRRQNYRSLEVLKGASVPLPTDSLLNYQGQEIRVRLSLGGGDISERLHSALLPEYWKVVQGHPSEEFTATEQGRLYLRNEAVGVNFYLVWGKENVVLAAPPIQAVLTERLTKWVRAVQYPESIKTRFRETLRQSANQSGYSRDELINNTVAERPLPNVPYDYRAVESPLIIEDQFGRDMRGFGLRLVDWDGHLANPAILYYLKPAANARLPMKVSLTSDQARLYFDSPSDVGSTGPRKSTYWDSNKQEHDIVFTTRDQKIPIYLSIWPDRDGKSEVHKLTVHVQETEFPPPPKPVDPPPAAPVSPKPVAPVVSANGVKTITVGAVGSKPTQSGGAGKPAQQKQATAGGKPGMTQVGLGIWTFDPVPAAPQASVTSAVETPKVIVPLPPPEPPKKIYTDWTVSIYVDDQDLSPPTEPLPVVNTQDSFPFLDSPQAEPLIHEPMPWIPTPFQVKHPWPFTVTLDFTRDQSKFFANPAAQKIAITAANDWAYFFDSLDLDSVRMAQEITSLQVKGVEEKAVSEKYGLANRYPYQDFLLYVMGASTTPAVGYGGALGSDVNKRNGQATNLMRSGQVLLEGVNVFPGYYLDNEDQNWHRFIFETARPKDLYSFLIHEVGHALGVTWTYPVTRIWRSSGVVKDLIVQDYQGHYPKINADSMHLVDENDAASRRGAFGAYKGLMPHCRWLITKLDLLMMQSVGHPLRATGAFQHIGIYKKERMATARVGVRYSDRFGVAGGTPSYVWYLEAGSLPPGLKLDSMTGAVSGTPSQSGNFRFVLKVADQFAESRFRAVQLDVVD